MGEATRQWHLGVHSEPSHELAAQWKANAERRRRRVRELPGPVVRPSRERRDGEHGDDGRIGAVFEAGAEQAGHEVRPQHMHGRVLHTCGVVLRQPRGEGTGDEWEGSEREWQCHLRKG